MCVDIHVYDSLSCAHTGSNEGMRFGCIHTYVCEYTYIYMVRSHVPTECDKRMCIIYTHT